MFATLCYLTILQKEVTSQTIRSTVSDLEAGEKYLIQVRTATTKGHSPYSDILLIVTNDMDLTKTQKMKQSFGINDMLVNINDLSTKMVRLYLVVTMVKDPKNSNRRSIFFFVLGPVQH